MKKNFIYVTNDSMGLLASGYDTVEERTTYEFKSIEDAEERIRLKGGLQERFHIIKVLKVVQNLPNVEEVIDT